MDHLSVCSGAPEFSQRQLTYLAELQRRNPAAFKAFLEQRKPVPPELSGRGDFAEDRGVYVGKYAGLAVYTADDFLRDGSGRQLVLNFDEARDELTRHNGGRAYGDGTEKALRQAIENGSYRDGDLVLPPKELLVGKDVYGDKVRPDENIFDLLDAPSLSKIKSTVINGSGARKWALSSSSSDPQHPDVPPYMYLAKLWDGGGYWLSRGYCRAAVVPVRLYRGALEAPTLTPGG